MLYLILLVSSAFGVLWMQIRLWISSLGKRNILSPIPHPDAFQKLIENTGIPMSHIRIVNSDKPYAMMAGLPGNPQMIISKNLYSTFSKDELEYVILHETAHYKYNHTLKELGVFIFSYLFCALIFMIVKDSFAWIVSIPLLALAITISNIQIARLFEHQADEYAARKMHNPHGMISATKRFMAFYGSNPPETSRRRKLFYRGNPYSERIRIAEKELKIRK
jgi:Zn-dependent protease with chaperone function